MKRIIFFLLASILFTSLSAQRSMTVRGKLNLKNVTTGLPSVNNNLWLSTAPTTGEVTGQTLAEMQALFSTPEDNTYTLIPNVPSYSPNNTTQDHVYILRSQTQNITINLGANQLPVDGEKLVQYYKVENTSPFNYVFEGGFNPSFTPRIRDAATGNPFFNQSFNSVVGVQIYEVTYITSGVDTYIYVSKYGQGLIGGDGILINNDEVNLGGSFLSDVNLTSTDVNFNVSRSSVSGTSSAIDLISTGAQIQATPNGGNNHLIRVGTSGFTFLESGNPPNIGDVWTASNTLGGGYWAAPSGGSGSVTETSGNLNDVNVTVEDLGGGATYSVAQISGRWNQVGKNVMFALSLKDITMTGTPTGEFRISVNSLPILIGVTNFGVHIRRVTGSNMDVLDSTPILTTGANPAIFFADKTNAASGTGFNILRQGITFPASGTAGNIEIEGFYIAN